MSLTMIRLRLTAAAIAPLLTVGLAAPAAHAHRAWFVPSATVVSGEDPWVGVDAAISNDLFYADHVPMNLDGVVVFAPDGSKVSPENASRGKYRSTFDLHLTQPGTWKIASVSEGMMGSYMLNGQPQRFRVRPGEQPPAIPPGATDVKMTATANRNEAFITRGAPTDTVLKPTGKGLELVPVTHPNDLVAGEEASFRLLLDGKPAAGVEVTVVRGDQRYRDAAGGEMKVKAGADGAFKVTWPAAGMYWINASAEGAAEGTTARRAAYTATLEVLRP